MAERLRAMNGAEIGGAEVQSVRVDGCRWWWRVRRWAVGVMVGVDGERVVGWRRWSRVDGEVLLMPFAVSERDVQMRGKPERWGELRRRF